MKRLALAAAALVVASMTNPAIGDIVTFDDLPGFVTPVPDNYAGLNWTNFADTAGDLAGGGFAAGVVSPRNVAYNVGGLPATIAAEPGLAFDLIDGSFTAATTPGLTVEAIGWRAGQAVAGDDLSFQLSATGPTPVAFNFAGIDRVTFTPTAPGGVGDTTFVLDNLAIRPVPEPSTALLLAIGGAGIILAPRHFRKNPQKLPAPRDR